MAADQAGWGGSIVTESKMNNPVERIRQNIRENKYAFTVLGILMCINLAMLVFIMVLEFTQTGAWSVPGAWTFGTFLDAFVGLSLFVAYFYAAYLAVQSFGAAGATRALAALAIIAVVVVDAAMLFFGVEDVMTLEEGGMMILASLPALWIMKKRGWRVMNPDGEEVL